jgi:hypothetical protein
MAREARNVIAGEAISEGDLVMLVEEEGRSLAVLIRQSGGWSPWVAEGGAKAGEPVTVVRNPVRKKE